MRSTNWRFLSWRISEAAVEKEFVIVLRPERGEFAAETVKQWAKELLFIHEGRVGDHLTLRQAVRILHRYNYAKVRL